MGYFYEDDEEERLLDQKFEDDLAMQELLDQDVLITEVWYDEPPRPFTPEWMVKLRFEHRETTFSIPDYWIFSVMSTLLAAKLEIRWLRLQGGLFKCWRFLIEGLRAPFDHLGDLIARLMD